MTACDSLVTAYLLGRVEGGGVPGCALPLPRLPAPRPHQLGVQMTDGLGESVLEDEALRGVEVGQEVVAAGQGRDGQQLNDSLCDSSYDSCDSLYDICDSF